LKKKEISNPGGRFYEHDSWKTPLRRNSEVGCSRRLLMKVPPRGGGKTASARTWTKKMVLDANEKELPITAVFSQLASKRLEKTVST